MFYQQIQPFYFQDKEIKYINYYIPFIKSQIIMTNPLYDDIPHLDKLNEVFSLLFPNEKPNPFLLQEFFHYLYPYYKPNTSTKPSNPTYDFLYDQELIYSSFLQAYDIDLSKPNKNLTIQKFLALFNGLPSSTRFVEVLQIRNQEIPKPDKYNNNYRNSIIKQKQSVELYKNYNLKPNQSGLNKISNLITQLHK